ncbi:SDR family oxidoreductase [Seongchinamella sediminis]|uniref:SDR family oxidoreductase n=1 Tax=Seongchinamella sediminis TaxID=2283635 RepID=A0A3L7DXS6_9GAMM|nr:SDR family oxidoreductase [Seongchinamella sediminis]RLQ22064.1 SDR family oxidoreductase [Seongchinamella sediminis]
MDSILNRFRLDGQVAIVTGSGRGIGAATALAMADAGANVVVTARTLSQIEETAEQVRARGAKALTVTCDVLDPEQRKSLVEQTVAEFGRIDVLVNNAGGAGPKPALHTSADDFDETFRFNVTTAFSLSCLCAPHMVASAGKGSIVNISSVAGRFPQPGFAAYGVAKAGLDFMTRNLAQDFAPKVRVNAIAVGSTLTDALAGVMTEDLEKAMLARTPLQRLGQPEDIAACALFLASPAADYVTGEIYGVNGGLTGTPMEMPRANL